MEQNKRRINNAQGTSAPRSANALLMPTLLDRLRDDAPHRQREAPGEYALTRTQLRDIVQRDLTYLLNTSNLEPQIDRERYPRAAASTINFGVPPLAGVFLEKRQWTDVETLIKRAITDFEPRILPESLSISPLSETAVGAQYNTVDFEVRGLIRMDPYPMEFLVQSSINLEAR